jgi:uncharacterized membrane protein
MKRTVQKNMIVLLIVTAVYLLILFTRNWVTDNTTYNFLLWNLFLGFLPLFFAFTLYLFNAKAGTFILFAGSFLWLLFYPNSPYMLTDFIHLNAQKPSAIYDAIIFFSISILSLFYGFFSLKIIHLIWYSRYNRKAANAIIIFSILLSSFGIYLGRILRVNSWDLFTKPLKVMADIFGHMWPVTKNPSTYYIIVLFTIIQVTLLWTIHDMDKLDEKPLPPGNG